MKELEFKIVDNKFLSVADCVWLIHRIDAIYVRNSQMSDNKRDFAIYVQYGSEIVELYYRTNNELIIAREYGKLCEALQEINPNFDNSVEPFILINYANLKDISVDRGWKGDLVKLEFTKLPLYINGGKKKCALFKDKLDEVKQTAII